MLNGCSLPALGINLPQSWKVKTRQGVTNPFSLWFWWAGGNYRTERKIHKKEDAECDISFYFHWKDQSPVSSTFSLSSLGLPPRVRNQFIPTWNFHVLQIVWFFKYRFSSPKSIFWHCCILRLSNFLLSILQKAECFLFSVNHTFSC